jgi:hypothetical protein
MAELKSKPAGARWKAAMVRSRASAWAVLPSRRREPPEPSRDGGLLGLLVVVVVVVVLAVAAGDGAVAAAAVAAAWRWARNSCCTAGCVESER